MINSVIKLIQPQTTLTPNGEKSAVLCACIEAEKSTLLIQLAPAYCSGERLSFGASFIAITSKASFHFHKQSRLIGNYNAGPTITAQHLRFHSIYRFFTTKAIMMLLVCFICVAVNLFYGRR